MRNKIIMILFFSITITLFLIVWLVRKPYWHPNKPVALPQFNLKEKKVFSLEEYSKMYYDLAIETQIKPDNFFISKNLSQEIFKMLVQQYYDISYLENISTTEHEEYYIITGSKSDEEIGYNNIIRSNNSAVTLIIRIRDGAIISLFIES